MQYIDENKLFQIAHELRRVQFWRRNLKTGGRAGSLTLVGKAQIEGGSIA